MRKARDKDRLDYYGTELQLYQDLSAYTLQQRRALRPLLNILRSKGAVYRWRFPFCLSATLQGKTAHLCGPEDLSEFREQLRLPLMDLHTGSRYLGFTVPNFS